MALTAALVDQARVYVRRPTAGPKVEGRTQFVDSVSPWIKARLQLPASPETVDEGVRSRRRTVTVPTAMVNFKDKAGNPVEITNQTKVGIQSKQQLGEGVEVIYQVTADPEPIRKKRKVIGFTLTLRRVEDHEQAPLAVP